MPQNNDPQTRGDQPQEPPPPQAPEPETAVPEPAPDAPEVGEDLAVVADTSVEVPENPDWRVESWSGLPKLQCNYCGYSTMKGEQDMIDHVEGRHRAQARVKGASGLVGPTGGAL